MGPGLTPTLLKEDLQDLIPHFYKSNCSTNMALLMRFCCQERSAICSPTPILGQLSLAPLTIGSQTPGLIPIMLMVFSKVRSLLRIRTHWPLPVRLSVGPV